MSEYYKESTLSDSHMFDMLNANQEISKRIALAYKNGQQLTSDHIQEQLIQIKRSRISPLVDKVIEGFTTGNIILLYSPNYKIPQPLPFSIIKLNGKNKAIVFLNNYGAFRKGASISTGGESFNIPMKDLYVLMESAFIAYSYYTYPIKLERNIGIMKFTSAIYTALFIRIFNKEYALSMDQDLYNRVCYAISRFYLERVWGCTNHDLIHAYSIANGQKTSNRGDIELVASQYGDKNIQKVTDLLNFIKELSPRMDDLNMRYFTECFINTYRAQSLLSIDVLPYFLFTIIAALLGSYIINQPIIYDILKRTPGVNTFYAELTKIII